MRGLCALAWTILCGNGNNITKSPESQDFGKGLNSCESSYDRYSLANAKFAVLIFGPAFALHRTQSLLESHFVTSCHGARISSERQRSVSERQLDFGSRAMPLLESQFVTSCYGARIFSERQRSVSERQLALGQGPALVRVSVCHFLLRCAHLFRATTERFRAEARLWVKGLPLLGR